MERCGSLATVWVLYVHDADSEHQSGVVPRCDECDEKELELEEIWFTGKTGISKIVRMRSYEDAVVADVLTG